MYTYSHYHAKRHFDVLLSTPSPTPESWWQLITWWMLNVAWVFYIANHRERGKPFCYAQHSKYFVRYAAFYWIWTPPLSPFLPLREYEKSESNVKILCNKIYMKVKHDLTYKSKIYLINTMTGTKEKVEF